MQGDLYTYTIFRDQLGLSIYRHFNRDLYLGVLFSRHRFVIYSFYPILFYSLTVE